MASKSFPSFRNLAIELQDQRWQETFSQPRVFDADTLRLLNPQNGIMYSFLWPYALGICRDSRNLAQRCLYRTCLFRAWPSNSRRTIYFNPNYDVCIYQFTGLPATDFIPLECLFKYVEIVASVSPEMITSSTNYGLRSVEFSGKFANLKSVVIKDRHLNLKGEILRYGWSEAQWSQESRSRQDGWDLEWKLTLDFFEERNITITTSSTIPEAEGSKKAFMATFAAHHIPAPKVKGGEE